VLLYLEWRDSEVVEQRKEATMLKKRNMIEEDVLLKTRLLAEGVRYQVKGPLLWESTDTFVDVIVYFDDNYMQAETRLNPRSRLEVSIEGNNVTISEMGEVLRTATLEPRAPWRDALMSDGSTVNDATIGMNVVSYILTFNRCYTYDSGKGCKFCGSGAQFASSGMPLMDMSGMLAAAERSIEATVIGIQNGLRYVLIIGGAAPPDKRDQFTTDLFEGIMARFHESLDDDVFSQVRFMPSVYPPKDLGHFDKWKSFGINAVEMDCQVMDPAYYKAICPGRGEKRQWYEAQEAAVEVFGRDGGCLSNVVMGIEPMAGMLEGIEERISKGVSMVPLIFKPYPLSQMEQMQPATAEWYMEAYEKIDEIRLRHGGGYSFWQSDFSPQPGGQSEDTGPLSINSTPDRQSEYDRPLSINSKLSRILADEKAKAVLDKHAPGVSTHPQKDQGMGMSLRAIAPYSQRLLTDEILKVLDEELGKL